MAVTLREHLIAAGWPDTAANQIEGSGSVFESDKIGREHGRTDFREQFAIWKGELPPDVLEDKPVNTPLRSGAFLRIIDCYSCHGGHDHQPITPYRTENPPWTHWFLCPTNNEPVPMTISLKNDSPVETSRKILADLDEAFGNGAMLCAIFFPVRGKLELRWHTNKFPHSQFEPAVNLLREHHEKHGGLPAPTPLPRAEKKVFKLPEGLFKQQPPADVHYAEPTRPNVAEAVSDEPTVIDDETDEGQ